MSLKIKILISTLVIALVATGGVVIWLLGKNKKAEPVQTPDEQVQEEQEQTQPETAPEVEFFTLQAVHSPVLAHDLLSLWYFDGQTNELLRQHLRDRTDLKKFPLPEAGQINFAIWPDRGSDLILGTPEEKLYYDAAANRFIPYPESVRYIEWMPGGQRVAYVWSDQAETVLSVAKADLTDHRTVAALPQAGLNFRVSPNGQSFVVFAPGGDNLYFLVDGLGALESVRQGGPILDVKISPDGKLLALKEVKDGKQYLNTFNISTRQEKVRGEIEGDFTWNKDGTNLYWLDPNKTLRQLSVNTDTTTDVLKLTGILEVRGFTQLLMGTTENELFFLESTTNRLGRIELP